MKPFPVLAGFLVCVLLSATGQTTEASPAIECPAGPLVGVQVLSAQHGEAIDESAPPDLIPDEQFARGGTLHQVWKMNSDGPGWDFFVWCTYPGQPKGGETAGAQREALRTHAVHGASGQATAAHDL